MTRLHLADSAHACMTSRNCQLDFHFSFMRLATGLFYISIYLVQF